MPEYPRDEATWPEWHKDKIDQIRKRQRRRTYQSSAPPGALVATGADTVAAPTWVTADLTWGGFRSPEAGIWLVTVMGRFEVTSGTADPGRIQISLTDPAGPTPLLPTIDTVGWLLPDDPPGTFTGGFSTAYRSDGTGTLGVDGNAYEVGSVTGTIAVGLIAVRISEET